MKVTLTNADIANIILYANSEDSIIQSVNRKEFTMSFLWALRTNLLALRPYYTTYEQMRQEILNSYLDEEHSYTDEKTGDIYVKKEYEDECKQALNDLLLQKTSLDLRGIKFSCITPDSDCSSKLSFAELDALSFMIIDDFDGDDEMSNDLPEPIKNEV